MPTRPPTKKITHLRHRPVSDNLAPSVVLNRPRMVNDCSGVGNLRKCGGRGATRGRALDRRLAQRGVPHDGARRREAAPHTGSRRPSLMLGIAATRSPGDGSPGDPFHAGGLIERGAEASEPARRLSQPTASALGSCYTRKRILPDWQPSGSETVIPPFGRPTSFV